MPPAVAESLPGSEYFPANSVGILRVDVAQAVATSYFRQIREGLDPTQVSPEFARVSEASFELAELVDVATMSIGPDPDSEDRLRVGVGLIEARLTLSQLADIMGRVVPERDFGETQVGSFPAIDAGETTLVELAPGRFLLGYTEEVAELVRNPPRSDFMSRGELESAYSHVDREAIMTMTSGLSMMQETFDELFEMSIASRTNTVGFSLQASDDAGLVVRAVAVVDDPSGARAIADKAREWRAQALSTPSGLLNLTEVFRSMVIDSDAESVTLETQLPGTEVHAWIESGLSTFMSSFGRLAAPAGALQVTP